MAEYEFSGTPFQLPEGKDDPAQKGRQFSADGRSSGGRPNADGSASQHSLDELWDCYANHRAIVTQTIITHALSPKGSKYDSLCVLGTGNCLDLELGQLRQNFAEIALVDIGDSTEGVERQGLSRDEFVIVSGLDLSGVFEKLKQYALNPSRRLLDDIIHDASDFSPPNTRCFDVVASTCLLSQIINHAIECVGVEEHRFIELIVKLRQRHIEVMLKLLNPGGTALLITDFVASTSLPELLTVAVSELKPTLTKAIEDKNYFHGLNPRLVRGLFSEENIAAQLDSVSLSTPWRWVATPELIYACYSLVARKKA